MGSVSGVSAKASPLRVGQVETRTVSVHGRDVSYAEAGAGPLLLLIHGMAGTAENWQSVIEPLALRNSVIAPDFPGHGRSAPGGGDYSAALPAACAT
jgi:pimeloyl-ACP methyl ester carboxylesterase